MTCGLFVQEANAGRFGGGSRFRTMRSNNVYSRAYNTKKPVQSKAINRSNSGKLKSLLTGMLMGGLLASLFMGHGLGSAMISWFFLGMIVLLIVRLLQRRTTSSSFRKPQDYDH